MGKINPYRQLRYSRTFGRLMIGYSPSLREGGVPATNVFFPPGEIQVHARACRAALGSQDVVDDYLFGNWFLARLRGAHRTLRGLRPSFLENSR